ncbi:glucose regulated protein 78, partial [Collybia nuda]
FEELNIDLFNKTIKLVEQVLKDANCRREEVGETLIIGGSTRIPKVQQLFKQFFREKESSKDVMVDDAIIRGAAIQGGILSGTERGADIILVDICPHSLGVEIIGGIFSILIPRNTAIPTKKSGNYTTVTDNQICVECSIFEGEHSRTKYNNLLGTFTLSGIPPAPSGVPQIKVMFEVDASGILQARAVDEAT